MPGHAAIVQMVTDHRLLYLRTVGGKEGGKGPDLDLGGVGDHPIEIEEDCLPRGRCGVRIQCVFEKYPE